VVCVFTIL